MAKPMIRVNNGTPSRWVSEAVLFPFDNRSIPFIAGLRLHLVSGKSPGKKNPIVVAAGEAGAPDDESVRFYGTVIPVDGELRMWYMGRSTLDDPEEVGGQLRVCYATSTDGIRWEKPHLGRVEFNGNRNNNIVDLRGGRCEFAAIPVLYEPDDPDPNRRFKIVFESGIYGNRFAVAYSPDGITWTESPNNPVGPVLEQTGLIRFNGCYYVNGQGGSHFGSGRKMATFASYDFEHWTQAGCLSFRRDNIPPRTMVEGWNAGEQVHLGAGLWDRGSVILGVYDMWHGDPSDDRSRIGMDIGLIISHDALHFYEPIPDFRFIPAYEELEAVPGKNPTISHGQGMFNIGAKTMLWYEAWANPPVQVRLATWERDRLGYYETFASQDPHLISCPIELDGPGRAFANVSGLGNNAELHIELLDERFVPLPGFSGDDSAVLNEPGPKNESEAQGLRVPVVWKGGESIPGPGTFRVKSSFAGIRKEDVKLFALYVSE